MKLSIRAHEIPPSPIRKLVSFAEDAKAQGVTVHHLNIGQPDIPTPAEFFHAVNAFTGNDFVTNGKNSSACAVTKKNIVLGYGDSAGEPTLRKALSKYYQKFGYDVDFKDITITTGGSEAIMFTMTALCDPDDEILCFEPLYTNYNSFAAAESVRLVPLACHAENGFHLPTRETIEAKITQRTRAILVCTPNNPTGAVLTESEMRVLVDIAKQYNIFLVVDESYREFIYGELPHTSIMSFPEISDRVIMLDSLSKRYSVCGARLGCLVTKNKEVSKVSLHLGQARLCPPSLDQAGALGLLTLGDEYFAQIQSEYKQRRDTVVKGIKNIPGVTSYTPEGAFYLMVGLPIEDAEHFAKWLLTDFRYENETIMVAPGGGFYVTPGAGKNEIRIAYVLEVKVLERAMHCFEKAINKYVSIFGNSK
ncbi:MAG: pyridoxal phosphate-dependent aminotransferase [Deltaproteobacteria bacterium]|nr:pyridoxal phosphate-dependent aminotransferase [Deltaproteobacteria bacterium]